MAAAEPTKICTYSLPDLKNTTDDAIATYLNSKSFRQSHTLADVRLALSTTACVVAGVTFYLDYTRGFEPTKSFTFYACIGYFALNVILTGWLYLVEGSTVYIGAHRTAGVELAVESSVARHDPTYRLKIIQKQTLELGKKVVRLREVESPFATWFDEQGYFVRKPFETWLGNAVPWILENEEPPKELTEDVVTASGRTVQSEMAGTEVGSGKAARRKTGKKA
ncbi:hypothetical protein DRE_04779 [Drechslerella stenobrocha 248]|uniref:Signal peptidase complex subunit 2 n=1 Tax=Drechslerella stenobrocha 248 TaxID=1043628 RepID=W7HPF6_9PEZI|nr:hypothetical protein DRE_04779 [Drechslerella stenobrocha 248]